ncbi:ribosome-inactivating family protein [Streptomyces sp. NPDC046203]|uniref:ribosome-inactivating family protein n=1 Tax=Streptomyces sp. NPDC046203 TaxID=3154602 RepID=UPI0033EAC8DA
MMRSSRLLTRGLAGVATLALASALLYATPAAAAPDRPAPVTASTASTVLPVSPALPVSAASPASKTPRAAGATASDISQPEEFALAVQRLIYRMRHDFSEPMPVGPRGFTHRLLGRGNSGAENWATVPVGHLGYEDPAEVELVIDPADLYVRGFYRRSSNTLYHFRGSEIPDSIMPGAFRTQLNFPENYTNLSGITVNQENITGAVNNLMYNTDVNTGSPLQSSIELMAVTFAETARNRRVGQEVYNALRRGGSWQVQAHAEAITSWDHMGGDIRGALTDGDWDATRGSYLLDGQHGGQFRGYSATFLLGFVSLIKR